MITVPIIPGIRGQYVAVFGLARTGLAAIAALSASGAHVLAGDDNPALAASLPCAMTDLRQAAWDNIAMLVLSPGIPLSHAVPRAAVAAGVPIISDMELLFRACPDATYVGITGTNGKSTVTALTGHILRQAGRRVEIGGNLGQAALSLSPLGRGDIYVLELSSYQLDITPSPFCDIAVLLNLSPDHIDRHGDWAGYIAAKQKILRPKGHGSQGMVGLDDDASRRLYEECRHQGRLLTGISGIRLLPDGIGVEDGQLWDPMAQRQFSVAGLDNLPGVHNQQNTAAAYAISRALGIDPDNIIKGICSYPGLPHRQEIITTIGQITYINDSKATNADAAARALACYDSIYWIAGGRAKEGGIAGLEGFYPRIQAAYVIGEAAADFARHLGATVPAHLCHTLDRAVAAAHRDAQASGRKGCVLLSPACASWDQYRNFEERGAHFRRLVQELAAAAGEAA